jgi:hypothetical protein
MTNSFQQISTNRAIYSNERIWWSVLGIAVFVRIVFSFAQPFRADEFLHLHDAWMVGNLHLPYRDFFEHHACWYHFLLAPFSWLFTPEKDATAALGFIFFCRALSLVVAAIALRLMLFIGQHWGGVKTGLLSVILVSGVPFFLSTSVETRPDVPAMALWLLCLALLLRQLTPSATSTAGAHCRRTFARRQFLLAGVCLGAAVMFTQKLLFGLPGVLVALVWWTIVKREEWSARGLATALFAAGVAVPTLATLAFFATQGAAMQFFESNFLINARWAVRTSPWNLLEGLWKDSWLFVGLTVAGAAWSTIRMMWRREVDWAALTLVFALAGWLFGLCVVIPIADLQFFLIPLPLAAIVAAKFLSDLNAYLPRAIALPLLLVVVGIATVPPVKTKYEELAHRNRKVTEGALWAINNTAPEDTILDGWTGIGVFRKQSWHYGFLHGEIPPMIPQRERDSLMKDLRSGHIHPRIIADDENIWILHESLRPWVELNYDHREDLGIFVRRGLERASAMQRTRQ